MLSGHRSLIKRWDVPQEEASFSVSHCLLLSNGKKKPLFWEGFPHLEQVFLWGHFFGVASSSVAEFALTSFQLFQLYKRTITRKGNNSYQQVRALTEGFDAISSASLK